MNATLDNYKLQCELLGHSMDVRAVAAGCAVPSVQGQIILSGSRDKTVKVWKPVGNEYNEAITYQDHKNFVACIYYAEAERWICTGSNDATICIYQDDGYVPILTLKGHESTVCSIASGVEPSSLISGSWDKTARIWTIDQLGGVSYVVLRGHEAAVWAVATMPQTKRFITGSADKSIFYWNAKGEKLRGLKGHADCVRGLLVLANQALVSCANDAIIRYWNDDGECVRELTGHTNYIYSMAQNRALGEEIIVSCGEDSTVRMWNLATGQQLGQPIVLPTQSVWSVTCLGNGDIVTGSSDAIVRVFTKDPTRCADAATLEVYNQAVEARKAQMNETLGDVKKTDLPGPESLLTNGTRDGQTKMVRHPDGSVKCYSWELGKWNLVGDITGASGGTQASSGKTLHEGKEYDFVFSVDISDTAPPIKLPYNRGEDPWQAAQAFIHRHQLPQAYLEQVANFIVKNSSGGANVITQQTTASYQDPFTGGGRYIPGTSSTNIATAGNADPFTGGSSYSTAASRQNVDANNFSKLTAEKHFPVSKYVTFDNCDRVKVLEKLKEFNKRLTDGTAAATEAQLQSIIKLTETTPEIDRTTVEGLNHLLRWPADILFPVLDVTRLAVRNETIFLLLDTCGFLDVILPQLSSSAPNQLMIIRCLANMMTHGAGRQQVEARLTWLVDKINEIRNGSANLEIAIATFFLNVTISQTLAVANADKCHTVTAGIVEVLKWALDLEASYRLMQAIGNLTTTPYGQETIAQVVSVDYVMDKIRSLTTTPQNGTFAKLNAAGNALLESFNN